MKKVLTLMLAILMALPLIAEETGNTKGTWENKGQSSLQFAQSAFKNWASGGTNALSMNGLLTYSLNYNLDKFSWKNNLEVGYGFQYANDMIQKTDDKIDYASSFDYTAAKKWEYSGMLSFKTQMTKGYKDTVVISNAFTPAYTMLSLGMKYIPNDDLQILISPLTGKMTIVADPTLSAAGAFGVNPGQKVRGEFGGFVKVAYNKEIFENVLLKTKLELFSNYLENPQYIDVNWDFLIAMKINKYLSANIATNLIYDYDIDIEHVDSGGNTVVGPALQFKEMFSLGITFNF